MDKQKAWERNMEGDTTYEWGKGKKEGVWDKDTKDRDFPERLKPAHGLKFQSDRRF